MTATSVSFSPKVVSDWDPQKPLTTTKLNQLFDNTTNLSDRLSGSYTNNTKDHSHNGVDSILVPIGPNYLRNGSFEGGVTGWTATAYTGGTIAVSTSTQSNGTNSLAITSAVLANGGGDMLSDEYTPVTGGEYSSLYGDIQASVANVSSKIELIWYNSAKAQISASLIYSSISTPTAYVRVGTQWVAPATARFVRVKATGGVPALGSAVGTINFDGFVLGGAEALKPGDIVFTVRTTAIPGTLKMNGAAVSRTAYAGLFAQIGTTFGAGDNSTTFNLPEGRGEFLRGWDDGRGVDTGRGIGTFQDTVYSSHFHTSQVGPDLGPGTGYTTTQDNPRNIALLACIKY